ncbi:M81 family metallopeptidase [Zavarzinia sp. CC-PAN008]|uniref:M81 family metallopeptidase n=1 Tax=Zavarzinia sp. CC-PAN008 TaxID=3243332 RepID=UPI003F745AFE
MARLWHEGNSFAPGVTGLAAFQRREWQRGGACVPLYAGTATEMGGVVAFLEGHSAWRAEFSRVCAAMPGPPVDDDLLAAISDEIVRDVETMKPDGIYLSLHGALVGTGWLAPELRLVRRVRAAAPATPLALSFDLHANLDPALGDLAQVIVGYRTYPHVDMAETALRALGLLDEVCSGAPLVSRIVPVGAVLPSFAMRTDTGPMVGIQRLADAIATDPVRDVTPFGGFAYGDVPQAGASVAAVASSAAAAVRAARQVASRMHDARQDFAVRLPDAAAALDRALALPGAVAVLEPADNPLSGGDGTGTHLLAALLARAPVGPCWFAFLTAPDLVRAAQAVGVGGSVAGQVGSTGDPFGGPVLAIAGQVVALTDGHYVNTGPMECGLAVAAGPSAVIAVGGVQVIVTMDVVVANDPAFFALHGIPLGSPGLLCVKAKNHFRAACAPLLSAILEADTPGPAAADLGRLPFRHVPAERLVR